MPEYPNFIKEGDHRYLHRKEIDELRGIAFLLPHQFIGLRQLMGEQVFSEERFERARTRLNEASSGGLEDLLGPETVRGWGLSPAGYSTFNPKVNRLVRPEGIYYKEGSLRNFMEAYLEFAEQESARHRERKRVIQRNLSTGQSVPEDHVRMKIAEKLAFMDTCLASLSTMPPEVTQLIGNYIAQVQAYVATIKTAAALPPAIPILPSTTASTVPIQPN